MEMLLNSLPSRTWNRLGINDRLVKIQANLKNHSPKADRENWNADSGKSYGYHMAVGIGPLTEAAKIGLVETKAGEIMAEPQILRYDYAAGEEAMSRLCLHAGEHSRLSVILLLTSQEDGISAISTEIHAEKNAKVDLYVVQLLGRQHVCFHDIGGVCEESATVELTKLELGAGKLYAGAYVDLQGTESHFGTDIAYYVRSHETQDMNYVSMHHGKRTTCLMEASGTLEEDAHKAFRGTIDFQKGCAGAKGTESEKVLLFGENMVNQTIPLILCKEEDVEGNHGASIGQLDEKVLFYLQSRGFSQEEAQQMIAQSRIDAVCSKVPDEEIRNQIHSFQL